MITRRRILQYLGSLGIGLGCLPRKSLVRLTKSCVNNEFSVSQTMTSKIVDITDKSKTIITLDDVEEVVATHFRLRIPEMKSSEKGQTTNQPRSIAIYLCRELTNSSFPEIARHYGQKDFESIMDAHKHVAKDKDVDLVLCSTLASLEGRITLIGADPSEHNPFRRE